MTLAETVEKAYAAYRVWSRTAREERAAALEAIAAALDGAAAELVPLAHRETHLTSERLTGELARTTYQLRIFAEVLREGAYLDVRIDEQDANWHTGPRPDLRRTMQALGPVIVFAASNFPFAFSVAGGDTASALAAGCSVILKAHAGHPELSERTAQLVTAALRSVNAPEGLFQLITTREDGVAALQHPLVKAGAFTGSIPAGRALFDIAVSRPEPIPFFGELGSLNPVFVTAQAAQLRAASIAEGYIAAMSLGSGQFCTKPGILFAPAGFAQHITELVTPAPQELLNSRIHEGYVATLNDLLQHSAVQVLVSGEQQTAFAPSPTILHTRAEDFLADFANLGVECFGPASLLVTYQSEEQLLACAAVFDGQLTATIVGEESDAIVPALLDELREKAGRILWNQWSPGAGVTYAQQHGGPYPATTAVSSTAVGTAAIYRFLRPVAYQNFPQQFLPQELRNTTEAALPRRINGVISG